MRYAVRSLAKRRAFSLTVIGVLALGIGLNAAVFTMLKGIALMPIAGVPGFGAAGDGYHETTAHRAVRVSYPDYQDLRDRDTAFQELFGSATPGSAWARTALRGRSSPNSSPATISTRSA